MLTQVLSRGGKRLRPAIALLAGGFGDYDADHQIPLAASIELLHTATLVHDDVIDASDTRRGEATANASFGNPASVMLGDYMFAHAAELVARTGHIGVIRLFAETLMVMAKGELAQDVSAYDFRFGHAARLLPAHPRQDGIALRHGRGGRSDDGRLPLGDDRGAARIRAQRGDGVPDHR